MWNSSGMYAEKHHARRCDDVIKPITHTVRLCLYLITLIFHKLRILRQTIAQHGIGLTQTPADKHAIDR